MKIVYKNMSLIIGSSLLFFIMAFADASSFCSQCADEWSQSIRDIKEEATLSGPDSIPPYPDLTVDGIKELESWAETAAREGNDGLAFDITSLCADKVQIWEQEHGKKTNPNSRREEGIQKFIKAWNKLHEATPITKSQIYIGSIGRPQIAGKGEYELHWEPLKKCSMVVC